MKVQMIIPLFMTLFMFNLHQVQAQSDSPMISEEQRESFKSQMQAFAQELNLTEAQKIEFESIQRDYFGKMKTLRDSDGSRLSKYRQYQSYQKERKKSMKQLLTKEQYGFYKERQAEMEQQMRESYKERNGK